MKKFYFLILGLILLTFCKKADNNTIPALDGKILINGIQRNYIISIPSGLDNKLSIPLLFVFHGGGGDVKSAIAFGFNQIAEIEKFIVVYPIAFDDNWNDGRNATCIDQSQDDVKFIDELINAISKNYTINQTKIFASGVSNGGIFCNYLAFKLPNQISAIGAVVSSIAQPIYSDFTFPNAISAIIMNGTDDSRILYNGGSISGIACRGAVVAVESTVNKWVTLNECQTTPTITDIPDIDMTDGCKAIKYSYVGGKDNSQVIFIKIVGGGHSWPGIAGGDGNVCKDFNATQTIWEFFKQVNN